MDPLNSPSDFSFLLRIFQGHCRVHNASVRIDGSSECNPAAKRTDLNRVSRPSPTVNGPFRTRGGTRIFCFPEANRARGVCRARPAPQTPHECVSRQGCQSKILKPTVRTPAFRP